MKKANSSKLFFLKQPYNKIILLSIGLGALIWFLIRVIPKPSRATYPCQRAAFPVASAFVIWLTGFTASILGFKYLKSIF
jgi:hypothetical protein